MPSSPLPGPAAGPAGPAARPHGGALAALHRLVVVALLGFASGLPLALTGQAMQAWLTLDGLDLKTIGFLSLVGLPYTFKFLWAPLMDRFDLPGLGRRRGWLVLTQLALGAALWAMAGVSPRTELALFGLMAVAVAFLSASQDAVYDGYRSDLLPPRERGLGASLNTMGYRIAMVVSGGIAMIWTDSVQGSGWSWPEVYRLMAGLMVGAAVLSAFALPRVAAPPAASTPMRRDLLGFLAVVAAVGVGYVATQWLFAFAHHQLAGPLASRPGARGWLDLVLLLAGIGFTLPLAAWAARKARFETLLSGLSNYFAQPGATAMLVFIVLYKLGDAFAGSLMTPFLLQGMHFAQAEVGLVNKVLGIWLSVLGALVGGALMLRLGLWRALFVFGVLQMASNLGFWWLAVNGAGALAGFTMPPFDLGFVKLAQPTPMDGGLILVIAAENLTGGMGTAAFVAFLMSLTSQRFSATQYALLSAFASVGRVWVGPLAGVLALSIGWPAFFIVSTVFALPGVAMLWWLRPTVQALEVDPEASTIADD
ncbi:AmpG family muropeptide MFS transporter [Ideonella sp. YS5]|uniref:AmpG family muropeptide MFS transporter n=1 Tax=Ideonella sp. YS5 TaxID=3453714 RepID=UPI003EEB3915